MKHPEGWQVELESLLAAAECGRLSAERKQRLNELLREEDGALDSAVDQLEIEALLRWHHGAIEEKPSPPKAQTRRWPVPVLYLSLAASILLALGIMWFAVWGRSGAPEQQVALVDTWKIQATGKATFEVLSPRRVRLTRGELLVRSVRTPAGTLSIETPDGNLAEAHGTAFYIGTHTSTREDRTMQSRLTRVLVLAGTVTLTNALGAATANARELLVAPQGQQPRKIVATANSDFGFDLYRQLAKENDGKNLFFSPYSLASALTMAAEGARGETAREMGTVLRLPASVQRTGDDAQLLPFEMSLIHSGFSDLNRMFNAADQTPEQKKLKAEIAAALPKIQALSEKAQAAREARDWREYQKIGAQARKLANQTRQLQVKIKAYHLLVANALWAEKTYPFRQDFLDTLTKAYDSGAVVAADFRQDSGTEIRRINDWVEKQTGGHIKDLVDQDSIDDQTRLVLLNAVYFQGEWVTPFAKGNTRPRPFTLADGSEAQTDMMRAHNREDCRYAAFEGDGTLFATPAMITRGQKEGLYPGEDGFAMLEMPYRGGDLAMLVLLPNSVDGLPDLEKKLTAANLKLWVAELGERKVHIDLPKYEAEMRFSLNDTLKALGIRRAFDRSTGPDGADFTGMTTSKIPEEQLFIAKVLHKAFVSVDEEGTKAAAATAVAMAFKGGIAKRVPFVPQFHADHPFIYLIRDLRSGTVLFLGRMLKP